MQPNAKITTQLAAEAFASYHVHVQQTSVFYAKWLRLNVLLEVLGKAKQKYHFRLCGI
jgi:hypothetical protein